MIFYIVVGVATILYILFLVFASKSWHWSDLVAMSLIYPLVVVFTIFAAATLRTHQAWRSIHDRLKGRLEVAQSDVELLRDGTARTSSGQIRQEDASVTSLKGELSRRLLDRGRIWRNCLPEEVSENSFTLATTNWGKEDCTGTEVVRLGSEAPEGGEREVAVAGGSGRPHRIEKSMILFAFLEVPLAEIEPPRRDAVFAGTGADFVDREQVCRLPYIYLGEFSVTEAVEDSITLSPTIPLSESQVVVITDSVITDSPWTLVEIMPVDSRRVFEGLNQAQLLALFAEPLSEEYIRDGKVGDRDRDPPERLMIRVRFQQDYDQIQVDAADDPPLLPSSDFDALGRAVPAWLRHGGEGDSLGRVEFVVGDEALFDVASAQPLITEGICEEIERVYVRPLYDFEYLFHELRRQKNVVDSKIQITRQAIEVFKDATAKSQESVAYRTAEFEQLTEDRTGFEKERQLMTKYRETLDQRYREVLNELSRLYRASQLAAATIPAG